MMFAVLLISYLAGCLWAAWLIQLGNHMGRSLSFFCERYEYVPVGRGLSIFSWVAAVYAHALLIEICPRVVEYDKELDTKHSDKIYRLVWDSLNDGVEPTFQNNVLDSFFLPSLGITADVRTWYSGDMEVTLHQNDVPEDDPQSCTKLDKTRSRKLVIRVLEIHRNNNLNKLLDNRMNTITGYE